MAGRVDDGVHVEWESAPLGLTRRAAQTLFRAVEAARARCATRESETALLFEAARAPDWAASACEAVRRPGGGSAVARLQTKSPHLGVTRRRLAAREHLDRTRRGCRVPRLPRANALAPAQPGLAATRRRTLGHSPRAPFAPTTLTRPRARCWSAWRRGGPHCTQAAKASQVVAAFWQSMIGRALMRQPVLQDW